MTSKITQNTPKKIKDSSFNDEYFMTSITSNFNKTPTRTSHAKETLSRPISAYNAYGSTSAIFSNFQSEASIPTSPSLLRKTIKISLTRPKSAFEDVRVARIADPSGLSQKAMNIRKFLRPDEAMIEKLKELTNERKCVEPTLNNLFYVQRKRIKGMDLDPAIILNYSLKEQSDQKLHNMQRDAVKKKVDDRLKRADITREDYYMKIDNKNDVSNKYLKFKSKDKQIGLLKVYTSTQKETIDLWKAVQDGKKDLGKELINSFLSKNDPMHAVLEKEKYQRETRHKSSKGDSARYFSSDVGSRRINFRKLHTIQTDNF